MTSSPHSDLPHAPMSNRPEEAGWFSSHLIETMPVGVCVCEMNGFVVAYNTRAAELWGQTPPVEGPERAKYCGSKNICQLDGTLLRREQFPVVQVLADGQAQRDLQFLIEQPSGAHVTTVANINPILNADGTQIGAVVCFQDISFKLRYEQQQLELMRSLQHGARLAAITHMAAEWAHDFNNLLHGVRWGLNLIRRRLVRVNDTDSCQDVDVALLEISKAKPLVQQLLTLARGSSSEQIPCPVDSTVVALANLMQHVLGPDIRLTLDLKTPDATVQMNRSVFEDVLMNLCVSARETMPTGGEVVMASRMDLTPRETSSDLMAPYLALSVRDNGRGMSHEQLRLALDPSSLGKQDCESSIVGFAMAKRFTTLSGGTFDLRSQSETGTNATLFLPVSNRLASQQSLDCAPLVEPEQPHPTISSSQHLRILLVEDDLNIQRGLTAMLQISGHEVMACSLGEDAIDILRSEQPLDLLISDHALPGTLQGTDVLEIAASRRRGLKTILITGLPPRHIARNRYQVLIKPFTFEELEQAMFTT